MPAFNASNLSLRVFAFYSKNVSVVPELVDRKFITAKRRTKQKNEGGGLNVMLDKRSIYGNKLQEQKTETATSGTS